MINTNFEVNKNFKQVKDDLPTSPIGFGYQSRAVYASNPNESKGRLYKEPESPTRTPFQRDRDRIIHSNAFRRLKHKTQVFIAHEDDHHRTRLTHTIEVSQIARALARALRLDEDLAEAIALVHDFGHTPFGHAGEDALNEMMEPYGGFDHNAQALRIVTRLEHRYAHFNGLNLCYETLEGLVKHNGPITGRYSTIKNPPQDILEFNEIFDLQLDRFASLEAQCAAIADDIAYNAHDIDDGLRADLINLVQLQEVEITADLLQEIKNQHPNLDKTRIGYELVRRQITIMVEDVINNSQEIIAKLKPQNIDDIHNAPQTIICFSPEMAKKEKKLKKFLYEKLYYHQTVIDCRIWAEACLRDLFLYYLQNPQSLPEEWGEMAKKLQGKALARLISDFLSGMTDNYAQREFTRLFDRAPNLS